MKTNKLHEKKIIIIFSVILILIIICAVIIVNSGVLSKTDGKIFDSNNVELNDDVYMKPIFCGLSEDNSDSPYSGYNDYLKKNKFLNLFDVGGKNIYLNINSEVNKNVYNFFGDQEGAVIAYNYQTGQTICQVSKSEDGNIKDKTISEGFTPGSIMKVVTAISAFENIPDIFSQKYECTGKYDTKDGYILCNDVHGETDFHKAFTQSCNSTFANISIDIGFDALKKTAENIGFNKSINVYGIKYKPSFFDSRIDSDVNLGWLGIGQHNTLVTPGHFLSIIGAIANGGVGYAPDPIYSIGYSKALKCREPIAAVRLDEKISKRLGDMLRTNVESKYGDSRFGDFIMCGKTGTAQVDGLLSHSWFAGYSQNKDFPYAIVCIVEYGGAGYGAAIELSQKTLECIYSQVVDD